MEDFSVKKLNFPIAKASAQKEVKQSKNQSNDINSATFQDPMARKKKNRLKKIFSSKITRILAVVLVLFIVLGVYTAVQAQKIIRDGRKVEAQARLAADALKKQDVELAKKELVKTQDDLTVLKKDFSSVAFMAFVPLANGYYNDAIHGVTAASHGVDAAITVTDSLIPYADVLGLKGEGTFVAGSAQDRIKLAVNSLGKVVPKIDAIEEDVVKAAAEIDKINADHYPNFWKFKQIREQIIELQGLTDEAVLAVQEAKPLVKVLPDLLGESEERKYLVLFQNDKELRPTGGFITFYAVFRVDQGVINVDRASDIYDLDNSIASHPKAPPIILKYFPSVRTFNIRDANLSPDFLVSMKDFMELYKESNGPQDIDGIIAIDTHVLVNILDILGEVTASGQNFNTKIDERCDCPQVVYVLENETTRPVNYVKENRKAIVGDLLYATMQKALSSSPKEYWGRLFQSAMKDLQEKHIVMYLFNEDAQKGVEALGWAGKIKAFEGDYLHINDANFGGAKSNLYVQQSVRMDYDVANDGVITKTLTVSYKNPYKHSDCNLERGGLCLNAKLRDFLRVYVPKDTKLQEVKGSEVKVDSEEDLGKTVFNSFITVNPLGQSKIIFKYQLPFKVENGELPLLIQKQSGVKTVPYEIYINGKEVEKFDLVADKVLTLKGF
jgi:hypothetical protein